MYRDTPESTDDGTEPVPRVQYDLVAEVEFVNDALPLVPTMARTEGAVVELEASGTNAGASTRYFSVQFCDFERFEPALVDDETVAHVVCVDDGDDRRLYRVSLTDETASLVAPLFDGEAFVGRVRASNGVWSARIRFGGRETLTSLKQCCRENDVGMNVRQLVTADESPGTRRLGPTPEQCEMLRLAYEMGYFDVPRRTTQTDLATRLDISSSAISQQLRRSMGALVEDVLFR